MIKVHYIMKQYIYYDIIHFHMKNIIYFSVEIRFNEKTIFIDFTNRIKISLYKLKFMENLYLRVYK